MALPFPILTPGRIKTGISIASRLEKIKKGIDILLTHSPAFGIGDGEDNPHKGFEAFVDILDKYKPKYFIHGHVHLNYSVENKREREYKDTIIINGYDRYVFEYPDKYILKGSGSDS